MAVISSQFSYPFLLSLPERVVRLLGAVSGGLLRELGEIALPARIRRTALYRTMVEITLRFMIQEVGQVEGVYPPEGRLAQDFLLKRGASHCIELLGLLTLHVSPIWILAALADASGAGHALVLEITEALKNEDLLDANARFETVDQLLDGLEKSSARLAEALNVPPLNTEGLRQEWLELKRELPKISRRNLPAPADLQRMWDELVESAAAQKKSVFTVCSLLAVSSIAELPSNLLWLSRATRVAGKSAGGLVGGALLEHYKQALDEISRAGFFDYWKRQFRPYLRAAAAQFAMSKQSSTERLLAKHFKRESQ